MINWVAHGGLCQRTLLHYTHENLRTQQLCLGNYSNLGPSKIITVVINTEQ